MKFAVVGATGAVGRALVQALDEGGLCAVEPTLLASERSAGTELDAFGGVRVGALTPGALHGCGLAFFAAGAAVSRDLLGAARAAGCAVVDLSPAFRGEPDVPLVVPELNADAVAGVARRGVVALPGAEAAQLALALAPLHRAAGLERISVVGLESVSAGGRRGVDELEGELRAMLGFQEPPAPTVLPHRVAFNLVPQAGAFAASGAAGPAGEGSGAAAAPPAAVTGDEAAVGAELRRLLGSSVKVDATVIRVPVFYGHLQVVTLRTRLPLRAADARELLRKAPGVKVIDAPSESVYPMPMLAVNDEAVLVGRLRDDPTEDRGLALLVAGDNVRRAAAGALGIAQALIARGLVPRRGGDA